MFWSYVIVGSLILLDVITGIMKAGYEHNIKSTNLRKGLYHKLSEIIAIVFSHVVQYGSSYINIDINFPITTVVITYISVMEITSIIENICKINPDLFKVFQKYIHTDESGDDNE